MTTQSVLFDVPGPKAVVRYRIAAAVGVVAILALIFAIVQGLNRPGNSQWTAQKWSPFLDPETWTAYLLPGLGFTLRAAALAVLLSVVIGFLLGVGRLSQSKIIGIVASVVVEFFRSVPVLIMMLFSYFFGQYVLGITGAGAAFFGVVAGLTLYNSAVIAELVRSGVGSLPKGQREAGLAIGMTPGQTLSTILLPQAVTAMLPSLISQLVVILKDTALGAIVTYSELLRGAQTLASLYGNSIPAFMVAAVMFILINYTLTVIARVVEKRLRDRGRGGRPKADPLTDPAQVPLAAAEADRGEQVQPGSLR